MKNFAKLFTQLDQTTKTTVKVAALAEYFKTASPQDQMWTIAILSHRRPKRTVKTAQLREWAADLGHLPLWLFEESYHVVGDLAETIALVLPLKTEESTNSLTDWINFIKDLKTLEDEDKKIAVQQAWMSMDYGERFIFNKLITGGFRVGVSQKLMTKSLSKYTGIDENKLAYRLMGNWTPDTVTFEELVLTENPADDISKPFPFYLAYALEVESGALGDVSEWQAEHKWDGIRGQIIVRNDEVFVWSRGEELVTDKFPEYHELATQLPNGTVLDGEILPYKDGAPLSFNLLQTRIGRKNITKKILMEVPVVLKAYDLLEYEGVDLRSQPLSARRAKLEALVANYPTNGILQISDIVVANNWEDLVEERANSRARHSEGLMLKRKKSPYLSGRKKGDWWKWKVDPLVIDAVMIYAQRGHGRRANLYTDFTFAVWNGDALVPFTKAYSGLKDVEFREITKWVNKNTKEKFGPVRSVKPFHVFEIAFEGIRKSTRHKSGLALRFPRMSRWRKDKPAEEANTLADLEALLTQYG